jgi:hypothetical protein
VLWFALLTALFPFAIWWYYNYDLGVLIVAGIYYLLFTLPSFYLHFEYAIKNAGEEITINHDEIIVRKNGKERRYSDTDLAEIIVYRSASLDKWGIPFTAMEYYHYARIITKSGVEIIITCLLTPKVDEVVRRFGRVDYERRKSFFCSIRLK